ANDDGWQWRKYGEKLVKGSPCPRSYYKCSQPGCPAKKIVERDAVSGAVLSTQYKDDHNHAMPGQPRVGMAMALAMGGPRGDGDDDGHGMGEMYHGGEAGSLSRLVDLSSADDGYKWRKYGQKTVKGNPNPRSYYKCTHPHCAVRKHVEVSAEDPSKLLITYEGRHSHPPPNGVGHRSARRVGAISPAPRIAVRREQMVAAAAAAPDDPNASADAEEAAAAAMHFLAGAEPLAGPHGPGGAQQLGAGVHRVAPPPGDDALSALETLAAAAAEHEGWGEPAAKVGGARLGRRGAGRLGPWQRLS
ncbi:MAG: WRKY DNA-binding domain-containing protein, partial [Monoraphidium minutum]